MGPQVYHTLGDDFVPLFRTSILLDFTACWQLSSKVLSCFIILYFSSSWRLTGRPKVTSGHQLTVYICIYIMIFMIFMISTFIMILSLVPPDAHVFFQFFQSCVLGFSFHAHNIPSNIPPSCRTVRRYEGGGSAAYTHPMHTHTVTHESL